MSEEITPGQLACIAWNGHYAEQHAIEARNEWAASDPRGRAAWEAAASAVQDPVAAERDKAYEERAKLVSYLTAVYPSELYEAESDSGAWWLVFVATPSGQMSWHIHEDDLELFPHLLNRPTTGIEWDGHTTKQKYERLAELTRTVATGIYGPQPTADL